jgi:Integrase core domain
MRRCPSTRSAVFPSGRCSPTTGASSVGRPPIPLSCIWRSLNSNTAVPACATPQTNGFVERFHRTVKEEFFEVALRETFYDSVEALQADLDRWLVHYNTERPHLGYRNMGKRPLDTINGYLSVTQEAS